MTDITANISAIVAVVGAIVSVVFGLIAVHSRAQKEVGDLYDQMVKFRTEHPEVLRLSRSWTHDCWSKVYIQSNSDDVSWVTYYNFLELCLGYCNTVLLSQHWLSRSSYLNHHKPLIKLLLTEHNPIIEDLLQESVYISPFIEKFRKELEQEGWNWREQHMKLAT